MTIYEIFEKVRNHLLEQGRQAKNGTKCRYRSDDGLKCAVGCLIPDDEYSADFEGMMIEDAYRSHSLWEAVKSGIGRSLTPRDVSLLSNLQTIHDKTAPFYWPNKLNEVEQLLLSNQY